MSEKDKNKINSILEIDRPYFEYNDFVNCIDSDISNNDLLFYLINKNYIITTLNETNYFKILNRNNDRNKSIAYRTINNIARYISINSLVIIKDNRIKKINKIANLIRNGR